MDRRLKGWRQSEDTIEVYSGKAGRETHQKTISVVPFLPFGVREVEQVADFILRSFVTEAVRLGGVAPPFSRGWVDFDARDVQGGLSFSLRRGRWDYPPAGCSLGILFQA
jgi:hypothetical protein